MCVYESEETEALLWLSPSIHSVGVMSPRAGAAVHVSVCVRKARAVWSDKASWMEAVMQRGGGVRGMEEVRGTHRVRAALPSKTQLCRVDRAELEGRGRELGAEEDGS